MSIFRAEVVPLKIEKHPNADRLAIARVFDYPVVIALAEWEGQQKAVYIPVDALVPDTPEFAFLGGKNRITARRFRGIFSQGLLIPAKEEWPIGYDVTEYFGITKYEPPAPRGSVSMKTDDGPSPPGLAPTYTDIENLRRFPNVLVPGEETVVTEKLHGCNARLCVRDGVLYVGSRTRWKKYDERSPWWMAVQTCDLEQKIRRLPEKYVVFGEAFGGVQDLNYSVPKGKVVFAAFDLFDSEAGRYVDYDEATAMLKSVDIPLVPEIYRGPFDVEYTKALAEQDSFAGCLAEGVVVRPVKERLSDEIGRVLLKIHSQRFLLRK